MRTCPGCGLQMPARPELTARTYYNTTPECWSVYTEVLGAEYSNAVVFGQVHQLTVDAYASQHAGGPHPDKSVDVHLVGLHLVLVRGIAPTSTPSLLQRLAENVREWPHYEPPSVEWPLTVFDVAVVAASMADHVRIVREWAKAVWDGWLHVHEDIEVFAEEFIFATK